MPLIEAAIDRGLKLTDHSLKVIERVVEQVLFRTVDTGEMQFGCMPGRGTIDVIFIAQQRQEKHLAKDKIFNFTVVNLEKAFDCDPREVLWWAMRYLGVPEKLVSTIQVMYAYARSKVTVIASISSWELVH